MVLGRQFGVVVVVHEQCLRIRGMSEFKGLGNKLFAAGATPTGLAEKLRAVVERLVDDVPHRDPTAVAADDSVDVVLQPREEQIAAGSLLAIAEKPARRPVVLGPNQAMADNLQVASGGEVDEGIGLSEVELTFRRLNRIGLEAILGCYRIKLCQEQRPIRRPCGNAIARSDAKTKQPAASSLQRIGRARLTAKSRPTDTARLPAGRRTLNEQPLPEAQAVRPRSVQRRNLPRAIA